MQIITSRDNETIKYACKIGQNKAFRQSEGCFLAEGLKLCLDLAKTCTVRQIFYTQAALAAHPALQSVAGQHAQIAPHVAQKMASTQTTQGVFALLETPVFCEDAVQPGTHWLCMENIQDPSNVGAMLRSAAAFGFTGAILCGNSADAYSPKALRAGMSAQGVLPLWCDADVQEAVRVLQAQKIAVYAAALQNSVPLQTAVPPTDAGVAVLIGNEGNGLTDTAIAAAHAAVRIPMSEQIESLNAAVAASVLLWHFRRI